MKTAAPADNFKIRHSTQRILESAVRHEQSIWGLSDLVDFLERLGQAGLSIKRSRLAIGSRDAPARDARRTVPLVAPCYAVFDASGVHRPIMVKQFRRDAKFVVPSFGAKSRRSPFAEPNAVAADAAPEAFQPSVLPAPPSTFSVSQLYGPSEPPKPLNNDDVDLTRAVKRAVTEPRYWERLKAYAPADKPAYCERCAVTVPRIQEHLQGDAHAQYSKNPNSWKKVDEFLAQLSSKII